MNTSMPRPLGWSPGADPLPRNACLDETASSSSAPLSDRPPSAQYRPVPRRSSTNQPSMWSVMHEPLSSVAALCRVDMEPPATLVPPSPNTSERLRSRRCTFAGDDGDSSFEDYLAEYAAELPPEAGVVKQRRRSSATGEAYPRRYTISNGFALAPSSQLETVKACLSAEITDPPTASPRLARSLSQRRNAKRAAERRVSFSGVGSPAEDLPVSSAVFEDADDTPSVLAMQGGLSPRLTSSKSLTLRGRRATVGVCPPISPPRKPGAQAFRGPSSTVFDDVEDWEFGTLRSDAAHLLAQSPMVYAQSSHHQSSSGAPIQDSQTSMPEPLLLPEAAGNTGGSKSTPRGRRATINGELHHVQINGGCHWHTAYKGDVGPQQLLAARV
eukprot:jgi/Tetstr1/429005/TSEL_018980.t1